MRWLMISRSRSATLMTMWATRRSLTVAVSMPRMAAFIVDYVGRVHCATRRSGGRPRRTPARHNPVVPSWMIPPAHRRTWRRLLVGLAGLAGLTAAWAAAVGESGDPVAVVGLLVSAASLAVAIAASFPRGSGLAADPGELADDLARTVDRQWREETQARRLRAPRVLPLTWSAQPSTRPDTSATARSRPGRVLRTRLEGRLDGTLEQVTKGLADDYGDVPSGRLVVLGEPGAGKTVIAMLLTLGLLDERTTGEPVPMLLTVSSWDPVYQSLDDWFVETVAVAYYNGQDDIPRTLLNRGLLLPVLDGLDEIPESARRSAVRAISQAVGVERPVIVTCRSAEYADVIKGGAPVLYQAPVVQVQPVEVSDVIAYLRDVTWPAGLSWEPVFAHLRSGADTPAAQALSTPLMVTLARLNYSRCGGDPAELLDAVRFNSRHAIEDHLLDRAVPAAYAPDRLPSGEPASEAGRWDADRAQQWLTFLARYLHHHRERDLAWWQLSQRLLSGWAAPGVALTTGVLLMIMVSAATAALFPTTDNSAASLATGAAVGAGFAVLAMLIWYASAGRSPGRLAVNAKGSSARLRRGFVVGVGLTGVPAVPGIIGVTVAIPVAEEWDFSYLSVWVIMLTMVGAAAAVIGAASALDSLLNAPPARSVQASPAELVRHDRRSSLVGAAAAGAVVGLLGMPALMLAMWIGSVLGQGVAGGFGMSGVNDTMTTADLDLRDDDLTLPALIATAVMLPGVVVALLVLLTRAWPRFLVARAVLAARGRLPLRLMAFLADARDRDLLRQSGGVYQFRHIRLQERLATQPLAAPPAPAVLAPARATTHARRWAVPGAAMLLLVGLGAVTLVTANHLGCKPWHQLPHAAVQTRAFTDGQSECLGIVPQAEWAGLTLTSHGSESGTAVDLFNRLTQGNEEARRAHEREVLAVLGPWRSPGADPTVLLRRLTGVQIAQQVSARQGRHLLVLLVNAGKNDEHYHHAVRMVAAYPAVHPPIIALDLAGPAPALISVDRYSHRGLPRYEPYRWQQQHSQKVESSPWIVQRLAVMEADRPWTGVLRHEAQDDVLSPSTYDEEWEWSGGNVCEGPDRVVLYDGPAERLEDGIQALYRCGSRGKLTMVVLHPYIAAGFVARTTASHPGLTLAFPAPPSTQVSEQGCIELGKDDFLTAYQSLAPQTACQLHTIQAEEAYQAALTVTDPVRWLRVPTTASPPSTDVLYPYEMQWRPPDGWMGAQRRPVTP